MPAEPLLQSQVPGFRRARQGARRVRPRRHARHRRHRPHQRVRLGPAHRHPGQGPRPHRADALLVELARTCRTTCSAPISLDCPPAFRAAELAAARCSCARRPWCRSSASRAATSPAPAGRNTRRAARSAASRCRRACRSEQAAGADLHPGDQGRRQGTTRTSPSTRWRSKSAARRRDRAEGADARRVPPRGGVRRDARHHPRRHEVRVGPLADGRD